jgi:uracil-DNA glycosylase
MLLIKISPVHLQHPSPYSADKGFFGNNHFRLANEWLEKRYGAEGQVDWCSLEIGE